MNGASWLLPLSAVGYASWVFFRLRRVERNEPIDKIVAEDTPYRQEIIGRNHFVLDLCHSRPQAAIKSETEKVMKEADIFVPTNVSEHPRQIPPEDLDEVLGVAPEGESNEPLEIDFPLYDESFLDADVEEPNYNEDEDNTEELPLLGHSLAQGVSFEQMGEAYCRVVHDPPSTDGQRKGTGHVLLGLKQTDMFEIIVSDCPDGNDGVKFLISTCLSAFHRCTSERSAESPSPQGSVPTGFDVRKFV